MPTLNDVNPDRLFVMIKGEPGSRKSTQALTFPGPQYWFSVDKKMGSLLTPMKKFNIDPKTIHYDDYSDWMGIDNKMRELIERGGGYKTIIFDSITSIGDAINIQTKQMKSKDAKEEGKKAYNVGGVNVNTFDDYKAEASAFTDLISNCKMIQAIRPVHIILIAHVVGQRSAEQVGVTNQARIIVTGGKTISAKIPAYCDEVYHFNVKSSSFAGEGGTYECITEYTGDDFARTSLELPMRFDLANAKEGQKQLYKDFVEPAILKMKR